MNIAELRLPNLRTAIQNQQVSFPSQVPIFVCQSRADIQWRLVELYFIHNWSCAKLGKRYNVAMERVRQLITQWVRRAKVLGYLQEIPEAPSSDAILPGAQWSMTSSAVAPGRLADFTAAGTHNSL